MDLSALILLAHRGAPTEFPENTIESFRAAKDSGADVIEMDVRTTLDGEWIIFHDETLDRCTFTTGRVDERNYDELRTLPLRWPKGRSADIHNRGTEPFIPRLVEVLDAFPDTSLNIDLKDGPPEHVEAIMLAIVERTRAPAPATLPHIRVTSESDVTQKAIRRFGQGRVSFGMSRSEVLEVVRTAWLFGGPIERLRGKAFQAPAYVHALGLDWPILSSPVRRLLEKMDCPIHLWRDSDMVDMPHEADLFAATGATGIFTNEIDMMVTHCRRKKAS